MKSWKVRNYERKRRVSSSMHVTEDEEADDLDDTDEDFELNRAFVSALFDEIDDLRMQVRNPYPAISASAYQAVPVV